MAASKQGPAPKPSFEDFIATTPMPVSRGGVAWIEGIEEFKEACRLYRIGTVAAEIRWWLVEGCGYSKTQATANTVDTWLKKHVDRDS